MNPVFRYIFVGITLLATSAVAQVKQFVGTVSALKPESAEIVVKPDTGDAISTKVSGTTVAQRIAPGEKDLKKAETVTPGDVAVGDRVLVAIEPGTTDLRRIIIMSATDIKSKNEKDRQEWTTRGISGVVTEKKGDQLTLKLKAGGVEKVAVVTVAANASLKRYAPDSVKFTDAKPGKLSEIAVGDQVRARGEKSADGLAVKADELVFGTFQTRAGEIVSVDAEAKQLTVKEVGTDKTFIVKITGESQVKALPDFGGMGGRGGAPGGMPGGGAPGGMAPGGMAGGATPGGGMPGGAPGGRGPGMPDVNQMIESMPLAGIDALKPGQSIIVSSTKSANPNQLTAITLVGNAGVIIRMAQASAAMSGGGGRGAGGQGMGQGPGMGQGMGGAMGGMGGMGAGGMGGFDLSGMTP
jgi:hypothetical protein